MRRTGFFLAFLAFFLASLPALAQASELQIHLLVMGPGDHLYTRGGHAAILVAEMEGSEMASSTVYNYGDTDWDDPMLVPHFLRGDLTFFLSDTGDLLTTLEEYGVRQGREVTSQRLRLTPDQAAEVARRLREGVAVGKREYVFHHRHAVCSTKIMDLLDSVLGGRLHAELEGQPGPITSRQTHELIFGESPAAAIAGDLFIGRVQDQPMNRYESTASPALMGQYLQTILVPEAPGSDRLVPFADAPQPLVARKTPLVLQKSWFTEALWGALAALLLVTGASAYRRASASPERAAKVVFRVAVASGVYGLLLLAFLLFSRVPEFRYNELLLLFWPTDLWLAFRVRRAVGQKASPDSWARGYAHVRFAGAALVVLGHLAGVLYQKPLALVALGCVSAAVSWALIRAVGTQPAPAALSGAPRVNLRLT